MVLRLGSGSERNGRDLVSLVEEARLVRSTLDGLHAKYNRQLVEQAAIAGVLRPDVLDDLDAAAEIGRVIAARLDNISDETERGWQSTVDETGFTFERTVRGVGEVTRLDIGLLASADARRLNEHAESLLENYKTTATLTRREDRQDIFGPVGLLEAVLTVGRKGVSLQRYKGLGEMNAEQLWETTLDINVRSLLQVKAKEGDDADDIFTRLMGEVVEPRREFIQDNALSVSNLDV
jgi:DNA gyrase subunit B